MRLGQLARKLNVRPADVFAALPPGTLQVEWNSNTRLSPELVREAVQFFRPDNWTNVVAELLEEESTGIADEEVKPIVPPERQPETAGSAPEVPAEPEQPEPRPELIKAPKIELPGLKVIGKIELPEKKPKASAPEAETTEPKPEKLRYNAGKRERPQKNPYTKNPIALAREQRQRELEKQKRIDDQVEKERRTKKYKEKVARHKPPKPVAEKKPTVIPTRAETHTKPEASPWGKFKKWLFRD